MASSLVAVRSLQLRCGELRADVDGCRAALCADGLQLHTAWREQQAQVRLMCEEQRRRAAQREAELQAQLHSAQEAHAEVTPTAAPSHRAHSPPTPLICSCERLWLYCV